MDTNGLYYGKQSWDFSDVKESIPQFLDLYKKRPIKNNRCGMRTPHLFWTWYAVRKLKPKNIIESGILGGQGTWLFRSALPDVNLFSIDPVLDQRVYVDKKAKYYDVDFSTIDWNSELSDGGVDDTLCFFDDHQDTYMRMLQMKWMGFRYAMFEDNYPVSQGDCYSLKKIFSEKGFIKDNEEIIKPNKAHSIYTQMNLETYTTFPPLVKTDKTRWGDEWNDANYPTENPILSQEEAESFPILMEEARLYTWICFIKLK